MDMKTNNELLTEFLGLKPIEVFSRYSISKDHIHVNCETEKETFESFCKSAKFDTDWNWLMQVVEKISDIKHYSLNGTIDWLSESQDRDGLYNINDLYNACVEFVKWYNEQYDR